MNCLDKLTKSIKCKQRNQRIKNQASFISGITIGGAVTILLAKLCCEGIRNPIHKNVQDINQDIHDDTNIKRDEIKQTLQKVDDESIGDVGIAIEKALEDLEVEK